MFKKEKKQSNNIDLDVNEVNAIKTRLNLMAQKSTSEQEKKDLLMASSLLGMLINIFTVWSKSKKTVQMLLKKLFGNKSEKSKPSTKDTPPLDLKFANSSNQFGESKINDHNFDDLSVKNGDKDGNAGDKKRKGGNGRNSAADYVGASEISVQLDSKYLPGQTCPECNENKLYKSEPSISIRLVGHAPVSAFKFILAVSRCICGMIFTAKVPRDFETLYNADKYGPSAIASILVYKYLMAVPFGLLGKVQAMHGIPLPASTQANQIKKYAVDVICAVTKVLKYLAANSYLIGFDDTIIRLLEKRITKNNSKTNNGYGTAVLANQFDKLDNVIVIYDFDFEKHAGQVVIDLLQLREKDKNLPLLVSDGLDSYDKCKKQGININCNVHARRKIVEEDPDQKTYIGASIIECYGVIYKNDKFCKQNNFSDHARMVHHAKNSKDSFNKIKSIFEIINGTLSLQESNYFRVTYSLPDSLQAVEPNDTLFKIANYFLKRFESLTKVMTLPGVPLDTNYIERAIKAIIRIRKGSLFFENLESAKYSGDVLSLLQTTNLNKVNVFIYTEFLITNRDKVLKNPRDYLPWLYDKDDEFKKQYWDQVKSMNVPVSNSAEYPFSEQTHSDRLTELLMNE